MRKTLFAGMVCLPLFLSAATIECKPWDPPVRTTYDMGKKFRRVTSAIGQLALDVRSGMLGKKFGDPEIDAWREKKIKEAYRLLEEAQRDEKVKMKLRMEVARWDRIYHFPPCIIKVLYTSEELFGGIGDDGVAKRFKD